MTWWLNGHTASQKWTAANGIFIYLTLGILNFWTASRGELTSLHFKFTLECRIHIIQLGIVIVFYCSTKTKIVCMMFVQARIIFQVKSLIFPFSGVVGWRQQVSSCSLWDCTSSSCHFTSRQITSLLYSLHFHYVINPRNQILKLFFSYHYFGSKLSNTADILIIYQSETRKICKLELYINFEQITSTLSSYVWIFTWQMRGSKFFADNFHCFSFLVEKWTIYLYWNSPIIAGTSQLFMTVWASFHSLLFWIVSITRTVRVW